MVSTAGLLAVVGAVAVAAVAGRTGHGPLYHLMCPAQITAYAARPMPDVPLAHGGHSARVGDRFAVAAREPALPGRPPQVSGLGTAVWWTGTEVFPTMLRCGRAVEGYRYLIFTAALAGDLTIEGEPVHVGA